MESYFKNERDYLLEILSKLVEQNTTNPPGNEYLAAEVVKNEFEKLNIPYEIHEKTEGRSNIFGTIGKGDKTLLIAAHLDVVPAGKGWETDPFKMEIKGERVFGRGVLDDKGLMASALVLAKYLKTIENSLNLKIVIAGVADEEKGSEFGMTWLADSGILKPDFAIIPDNAGNLCEINIAEKGNLKIKVKSYGIQAHAMSPEKGVNAIVNLSKFIVELQNYKFKYESNLLLDKPTMNIGLISGGTVANSVPSYAKATIDIRYLPSQTASEIVADFQQIGEKLKESDKSIDLKFEIRSDAKPLYVSPEHPLVQIIQSEGERYHSKPVKITGMGGGTVCKDLARNGALAICYSAGDLEFYHQVNENILINELLDYSEIMANVIQNFNQKI